MTNDRAVLRRQLFLLFVVACTISLAAEGRVVPVLVLDALVSFAFMPVSQVLGFRLVWRLRFRRSATPDELRAFIDGNTPWLWWWCGFAVLVAVTPPRSLGPFSIPVFLSLLVPFGIGMLRDRMWLQQSHARSLRDAWTDVLMLRFVTWGAACVWFYGLVVWHRYATLVFPWVGA